MGVSGRERVTVSTAVPDARALAAVFVTGGATGLAMLPLLRTGFRFDVLVALVGGGMLAAGFLFRRAGGLPAVAIQALFAYATFSITVACHLGDGDGVFLPFFAWIVAYAAWSFTNRALVLQLALVAAGMVSGTIASLPPDARLVRFLPEAATLVILTLVVRHLRTATDHTVGALEQDASVDELTGVLNRRLFDRTVATHLGAARALGKPVSLIVGDVDRFKHVNDTFGHPVGDLCLVAAAKALASNLRAADNVFRLGGDEFAVVLPGASIEEAHRVAETLRAAVATTTMPDGVKLTMSFGAASDPAGALGTAELYAAADAALYLAKSGGRNRTATPTPLPKGRPASNGG